MKVERFPFISATKLKTLLDNRHYWLNELLNWLDDHPLLWQRGLIIPGVLLLVAGLAYKLPLEYYKFVILAPFGVVGLWVVMRWPPVRLLVLIFSSMVVPLYLRMGFTVTVILGLTGLWVADMVIRERQIHLPNSRTVPPLIGFLAIVIVSFVVGQLPWYPVAQSNMTGQLGGLLIFVTAVCAFLMTVSQIHDTRWLMAMVGLYLSLATIYLLSRIVPAFHSFNTFIVDPTSTGSPFWYWVAGHSFTQAVFNRKLPNGVRAIVIIPCLMVLYVTLFEIRAWTSGWMPVLLALGVILWVGEARVAMAGSIAAFFGVILQLQALIGKYIMVGDNEYSALTRFAAWRIIGEIVSVNPLLGLGPANYRAYTKLFPILGWYVEFNSHNQYVDIVAQTGLLGLACYLWFFAEAGVIAWRLLKRVPEGGFERAYLYAAIGGLAATLFAGILGDWVMPFVYNGGANAMRASGMIWIFLGGLVVLDRIYLKDEV